MTVAFDRSIVGTMVCTTPLNLESGKASSWFWGCPRSARFVSETSASPEAIQVGNGDDDALHGAAQRSTMPNVTFFVRTTASKGL
jgi:hypothetical protein